MSTIDLVRVRAWARNGRARQIRQDAGVSRAELAAELGVHETTVAKWEAGIRSPRSGVAIRYLRTLDELTKATAQ